jgi:hypothetical protein
MSFSEKVLSLSPSYEGQSSKKEYLKLYRKSSHSKQELNRIWMARESRTCIANGAEAPRDKW